MVPNDGYKVNSAVFSNSIEIIRIIFNKIVKIVFFLRTVLRLLNLRGFFFFGLPRYAGH